MHSRNVIRKREGGGSGGSGGGGAAGSSGGSGATALGQGEIARIIQADESSKLRNRETRLVTINTQLSSLAQERSSAMDMMRLMREIGLEQEENKHEFNVAMAKVTATNIPSTHSKLAPL